MADTNDRVAEFIPSDSIRAGFDPGQWGNMCWDTMNLFAAAAAGVDTMVQARALIFWFHTYLVSLTRTLCCEPCRTSFTNLYWRKRAHIYRLLSAASDLAETADAQSAHRDQACTKELVQQALFNVSYDLQATVTAKIAGQRGNSLNEHIHRRYPSRVSMFRRIKLRADVPSSDERIADMVMMMALQIEADHSPRVRWVRYVALLQLVHALLYSCTLIQGRARLATAMHDSLKEHALSEQSCCHFTEGHDSATCAKALAWSIRAKLAPCTEDVEEPAAYAARLNQTRGRVSQWWDDYTKLSVSVTARS